VRLARLRPGDATGREPPGAIGSGQLQDRGFRRRLEIQLALEYDGLVHGHQQFRDESLSRRHARRRHDRQLHRRPGDSRNAAIPAQSARERLQRQPDAGAAARRVRAGRRARRRRNRRLQLPRAQPRLSHRAALDIALGRKVAIVPDDDDLPAFGRRADPSAAIGIAAGCREAPPVRDPYEILGVAPGASFEDIKAAYRRACLKRHPDMPGGSHEAMVELNTAYAFILEELKHGHQSSSQDQGARSDQAERDRKSWEQTYRDIDEELAEMRRAAEAHEEALRAMRSRAWQSGDRTTWAKLTWEDFTRFVRTIARSGVKGLALLFAALVGVGTVLVEANFVSALILLGSGLGFLFSLALKNDKGGTLSAALLLFGVMTIWLPPVRSALYLYPLATISVLILLALIFKFAQAGGRFGLMTGGVLAFYVIAVIVNGTSRQPPGVVMFPPPPVTPPTAPPRPLPSPARSSTLSSPPSAPQAAPPPQPSSQPTPAEPRTLLASQGAILKFVFGVPYHLKVRNGFSTSLHATHGKVALASADGTLGECLDALDFPVETGAGPWREIDRTLHACDGDAIVTVSAAR
jgi:DnaJ-domain-containing protein 1